MSEKISELPAASALDGTEEVPLVQSSATKKVTVNDLLPVQLQDDKEVDLNGHTLEIVGPNDQYFAKFDPVGQTIQFAIPDESDGTTIAVLALNSAVDNAEASFNAVWNGTKVTNITAHADSTTASLAYTADTHTFNGLPIMPDLIAKDYANDGDAAAGGIAVGGFYHSSGTLKIRLS